MSISSLNETEYLLFLSKELDFISKEKHKYLNEELNLTRQKLMSLRNKLIIKE
ncbi:four helix bundle protein [Bergeyella cardium]|uniref:four helix bundle protein n=1 Tax=Bergeyella cardium TaxID=1585976 RepID=UPI003744A657